LVGDYYRYGCEANQSEECQELLKTLKKGALDSYKKAQKACQNLKAYNAVKLGLALNFSVF
jgi:hypothetical protein